MKINIIAYLIIAVQINICTLSANNLQHSEIPSKENFHLFLLAGQSNMAGRGVISDEVQEINPRILMLTKDGKWIPAVDPIHYDKTSAGAGLARSFALELVRKDSTISIGLIPAACGGSPISTWEPGAYHSQTNSFPFDDAVLRTKRAMKDGVLKGILWHQGESDSNPRDADNYKENLKKLIERFRVELNAENVPFIIGQLGKFTGRPWSESRKIVDDAQLSISKEVKNIGFVSSVGLTSKPDSIHFETKSLNIFGKRYADLYLQLIKEEVHPRIYCSDSDREDLLKSIDDIKWKKQIVENKKANVDKYIEICKNDSDWLVSRLQMNWKTKHNKVFLNGSEFSHSAGEAPVPTVRFSGTRDWSTDYLSPSLEEIEPYFDDERGMYLENKNTGIKEWVHPSKTGHIIEGINRRIMELVQDAAFLYWFTGEKKYADFAAPVFTKYIEGMYYREAPVDLENSDQQRISGLATFEVIHEQIVVYLTIAYDFLYPYLVENKHDISKAAAVFQKWGDQIIKNGIPDNNWNLFQARFLTYIALALDRNENYENGKGREYFIEHTYHKSTERQIAIKESLSGYDQETAIWFESPSYSVHVATSFLEILTLLDNYTNNNEISAFPIIEQSVFASFQYLFPTGYTIAFGDAKHKILPPENFELLITNFRKYNEKENEVVLTGLLNQVIEKGEYKRGGKNLFELFFYVDELTESDDKNKDNLSEKYLWPTFYSPNVSWFVQRMGKGDDAMMVSTVGSFGNHSHVNGIAIELFANNYALAPDMSNGASYWNPKYREYYSQFPAHNTVAVDGKSTYGRMRGYHPYTLDNYFPEVGEKTTSFDKVTFSKVSFLEPETISDQQRLTAQIKSKSGKGYIVDIFRSRKQNPSAQKHEYFYHNLGQSLNIFDNEDNEMILSSTDDLGVQHGDMKAYDYFTDKNSLETSENIKALFTLKSKNQPDNFMKMWINSSNNQKVFSVKSPKSGALSEGTAPAEILDQKIPTIILRRDDEAWTNPFVVVFNPYIQNGKNPVSNVEFSKIDKYPIVQKITVTHTDGKTRDIIAVNTSENDIAAEEGFYQKGLLSIVRENDKEIPDFIFVSGVYIYEHSDWKILAKGEAVTANLEFKDGELHIQNDKPVVLYVPIRNGLKAKELKIYEDGNLVSLREGFISRNNPDCIEFRLEKPCKNAVISFSK